MGKPDPRSLAASRSAEDLIDRLCDQFEADLKAGRSPDLDQITEQAPAEIRSDLLHELIRVSLEYAGTSRRKACWNDSTRPEQRLRRPETTEPPPAARESPRDVASDAGASAACDEPAFPRIAGYEILEELGRGGMGVVYRARQLSVGRPVALKIIQGGRFETGDAEGRKLLLERFRTEAIAASRVDDRNIATVYDIGEYDGRPYYAMRLVEGTSLGKLVQDGPLPFDRAVRYLMPVARAIDRLHSTGVVHRDLKPSNILIEASSDTPIVSDFGLAKLLDAAQNVTLSDEGFGSPPYMAPEQVVHATSVSAAADVYSLGATLYHLLTGRPPFQARELAEFARQILYCYPPDPRRLDPSIPRDLETICLKCLEKDEHRRYRTAGELADDLQRFVEHRPIVARPIGRTGRVARWCRRNPAWATLAVTVVVLISLFSATSMFLYVRGRLAEAVASDTLVKNRLALSNERYDQSKFAEGRQSHESLPWLIECLKLDAGTMRELPTRQRIASVLSHGPKLTQIFEHGEDFAISCATCNRSGELVLTGGTDKIARIWSVVTGQCLRELEHAEGVQLVAFNGGGDVAATATTDGKLRLWNVATGNPLTGDLPHPGIIQSMAFSADDRFVVTASVDHRVRVWKVSDGSLHAAIEVGKSGMSINWIAISPTDPIGISGCGESKARSWNLESGEVEAFAAEHAGAIRCASFSPDGKYLITGGDDGLAKVWDPRSGRLCRECPHEKRVIDVRFDDDSLSAITSTDDAARVWPILETTAAPLTFEHSGLKSVAVDPTNRALLTIGGCAVQLRDLQDANAPPCLLLHPADVVSAQFGRDGDSILTVCADGTARYWDTRQRRQKSITKLPSIKKAYASNDGRVLLVQAEYGPVAVLSIEHGEPRYHLLPEPDQPIVAANISPDGAAAATVDVSGVIQLYACEDGRSLARIETGCGAIGTVRISPRGTLVATGNAHGDVVVYDTATSDMIKSFTVNGEVRQLEFSPRDALLLASDGTRVRLVALSPEDSSATKSIEFGGLVRGARFSADGARVALFGDARKGLVYDTVGGMPRVLPTSAVVTDVCFSPSTGELLTVSESGIAQLWRLNQSDATSGSPMQHGPGLNRGVFSPDGKLVALCGANGSLRVWEVESAKPVTINLHHSATIVHVSFIDAGRLMTVTATGDVAIIDVRPSESKLSDLKAISKAITGYYVDEGGSLVPVSKRELARLRSGTLDKLVP